jgi:CRP/FNR family transcriptional regulator, cyclic AMP receptor protein
MPAYLPLNGTMNKSGNETAAVQQGAFPPEQYPFFSAYSSASMKTDDGSNLLVAEKGDYIYFEPQRLNKIFFIAEGCIKIGCIDNNGNEIIKEILQPGDMFGQFSLECREMSGEFAQAYKGRVELNVFTIEAFKKILSENTAAAIYYSQKVGSRLHKTENRLMNMLNTDVKTRLLRFINEMVQQQVTVSAGNSIRLSNFLTHYDIAHLIGSTRQTVTTLFNDPEMQRMVCFGRKEIVVQDIKAMQRFSAY